MLDGVSLAFAGVSHKLKLSTSLGSHLVAIGNYPLLYASLGLCYWVHWVWFVGVADTNSGFIAIVASVLQREANLRQFFSVFY